MPFKKKEDPEVIAAALLVPEEDVERVWDAWVTDHGNFSRGRQHKLTEGKNQDIRVGIVKYGIDDCLLAISGILYSPWHMGDNPAGKMYNSPEIIFREGWRVKKFKKLLLDNKQLTVVEVVEDE